MKNQENLTISEGERTVNRWQPWHDVAVEIIKEFKAKSVIKILIKIFL